MCCAGSKTEMMELEEKFLEGEFSPCDDEPQPQDADEPLSGDDEAYQPSAKKRKRMWCTW